MSIEINAPGPVVMRSGAPSRARRDRIFFTAMALAAVLTVFAGFARTYFLKSVFGTKELSPFLHLHGLVFTSWVILFVVQTSLVAAGRTDIHRRLGLAGMVLAPLMVVIGFLAAIASARRGFTPSGGPPPLVFLVIPLVDLVVFSVLVSVGLWFRRQSETHKRLMLLAMIGLLTPAIARIPGVSGGGPPAFLGLTDLFIVVCLLYDKVTRGRVHRAFLWGGLFIVISQPLRFALASTGAWQSFARWLIS